MPTLSVLLPNYNNAPYLKECLDSLFSQTFQDFRVYFVDDCSTDNSIEIAEAYQSDKMVIIKKHINSGIVDTLNDGLDLIESKYFIRMDGDDINTPDRFEKLVAFMENNPSIDVCTSNMQTFGIETELIVYEKDVLQNKANLIFGQTIGHPSSIFRSKCLKENGIRYKNDYWRMEDYQLFYRLKDIANCTCLDEILYLYRRGIYNVNKEIHAKKVIEYKKIYSMIFNELGFEFNDNDLIIHTELANVNKPSNRLNDYKKHVKKLISANHNTFVFPEKELKICFDRVIMRMSYRLIDKRSISLLELFPLILKNRSLLKYYMIKKIRL